jgi:hypothetical protein
MAANLTTHLPITVVQTRTNTTEQTQSYPELAGQTFPFGSVVNLSAGGYTQLWPGTPVSSNKVLGVTMQAAFNLGSNAAGAPPAFGSVGAPGTPTTYGTVPNQPSAVNIPSGATFSDGQTIVAQAVSTTIFRGMVDNSAGSVAADWTATIANIGNQYGLTQSSSDQSFYVDLGKSTVGTNTVVTIVALDPDTMATGSVTTGVPNGNVYFVFAAGSSEV